MKIKIVVAAALAIAGAVAAWPQGITVPGLPLVGLGYCRLSAAALASAVGLSACSAGIPSDATSVILQAETENIRWTDDGTTTPTTSIGMLLISGRSPGL